MNHYQYLIIGGGLAADAAVRGIRELDRIGTIGLFSMESDPPYLRPNLSKGLWKGRPIEKIWRHTDQLGVEIHLNRKIIRLDPAKKRVLDAAGREIGFEKLLLSTGGTPVRLPFGGDEIIYFRDLQDYYRLRRLSESDERFLVIGGGFIGSEIAAALTMVGKKVTMVFLEDAIGGLVYPPDLAHFLNDYYRAKGVEVIPNDSVVQVDRSGERILAQTKNGRSLEVDGVVAGIGIRPNVALAEQTGLKVENGIVVDDLLRTSHPDIYAAGDVANFFHIGLGRRVRVEHEDNAIRMGYQAGRNMAGADEAYNHIPMFYSDLFDLGYEAVGELSSKLEIVEDWQAPFQKGAVYYLEDRRVRGVLLWNVWNTVPAARALLSESGPVDPKQLAGKLT
jgi:NADPH-dependent 2,4-dienoyl-CoA reductase/sulfur reductase-like enzyme